VTKAADALLPEIRSLIEAACHRAVTAANLSMVALQWNIGRVIAGNLQDDPKRAEYGQRLITRLANVLTKEYGRGFAAPTLWNMQPFHAAFEILSTASIESPAVQILSTLSRESPAPRRSTAPLEPTARIRTGRPDPLHVEEKAAHRAAARARPAQDAGLGIPDELPEKKILEERLRVYSQLLEQ
jgi:hypothetical protein